MASPADSDAQQKKVSLLGIGLMGEKTAIRLGECGIEVHPWNRTASATEGLQAAGMDVPPSAAAALQCSPVIVTMLSDADALREVLLAPECKEHLAGKWILQMGTIGPGESVELCSEVLAAGAAGYMEAPVLGSKPEASAGKLLIMVGTQDGADPTQLPPYHVLEALSCAGDTPPVHIGAVGTAAAVKLSMNQLIGSLTVGFSSSLGLCQANGVDVEKFMAILRPSALYAPTFDKKLQRMVDREYSAPNFPTKHLLKDMKLFEREAAAAGLGTALAEGVTAVVDSTVQRGLGDTDYSAVHEGVIEP